ncbi:MAG TPA: Lrp/AsnC ligand binding domain-containing protein [Thermomicrobiales bacterium]|nr:Lrp/AsnC ligand binding domain-containing protein [Thermomicrobiales bacterium]
MARAYILVHTEVGTIEQVQSALRGLAGVRDADVVSGDVDLVVTLDLPTTEDIGRLVMRELHGIEGVEGTTTYVVVG